MPDGDQAGQGWEAPPRRPPPWPWLAAVVLGVVALALATRGTVTSGPDAGPTGELVVEEVSDTPALRPTSQATPLTGEVRALGPAPVPWRPGVVHAWTGAELLVWGGSDEAPSVPSFGRGDGGIVRWPTAVAEGAAYDPVSGRWRSLPAAPLTGRAGAVSVWTGEEWFVWGGAGPDGPLTDGALYDPQRDTWTRLPASPLAPRIGALAVWTGEEVIVYGGVAVPDVERAQADGAAYDPATGAWRMLAEPPGFAKLPMPDHTAVFDGQEMLIWTGTVALGYNPDGDTWRVLPVPQEGVSGRTGSAVRAGGETLFAEAYPRGERLGYALRHITADDTWDETSGAPLVIEAAHELVWTGEQVLALPRRARQGSEAVTNGAAWDPATDRWRLLPREATGARRQAVHVWTGRELLTWGGFDASGRRRDGILYDPVFAQPP